MIAATARGVAPGAVAIGAGVMLGMGPSVGRLMTA